MKRYGTQKSLSALRTFFFWMELLGTPCIKPLARSGLCIWISSGVLTQLCISGKLLLILILVASQQWPGFLRVRWTAIHRCYRMKKKEKKKRRLVTTNNMICCCNPAWLHSLRDQISVSTCMGMDSCYVSRVGSSIWAPRLGSLCLLDQSWLLPRQNGEWVEPPHATASMQLWQKAFKRMQHFTLLPFLTSRKQQRSLNMLWFQAGFWLYVFFSIKAYPPLPLLVIFRTPSLQQLAKTTTKKSTGRSLQVGSCHLDSSHWHLCIEKLSLIMLSQNSHSTRPMFQLVHKINRSYVLQYIDRILIFLKDYIYVCIHIYLASCFRNLEKRKWNCYFHWKSPSLSPSDKHSSKFKRRQNNIYIYIAGFNTWKFIFVP